MWRPSLCHHSMAQVQWLAKSGKMPCKNPKAVGNTTLVVPQCTVGEFTKAHEHPTEAVSTHAREDKLIELKEGDLYPGQQVSANCDQPAVPMRLHSFRGSHNPKYYSGPVFVDHPSDNAASQHQISPSAADTIKAKLKYEPH